MKFRIQYNKSAIEANTLSVSGITNDEDMCVDDLGWIACTAQCSGLRKGFYSLNI